jgi:hypothetical protein
MPLPYISIDRSPIVDQPPPVVNDRPAIQDLVIADIEERKRIGLERYGTLLKPHNGRKALVDLYQEILDAAQYIRQEIEEREDFRAEGAAEEREKIVGYMKHCAQLLSEDCLDPSAIVELAQSIERGEHHDTWPAPAPEHPIDDEPTSDGEA